MPTKNYPDQLQALCGKLITQFRLIETAKVIPPTSYAAERMEMIGGWAYSLIKILLHGPSQGKAWTRQQVRTWTQDAQSFAQDWSSVAYGPKQWTSKSDHLASQATLRAIARGFDGWLAQIVRQEDREARAKQASSAARRKIAKRAARKRTRAR